MTLKELLKNAGTEYLSKSFPTEDGVTGLGPSPFETVHNQLIVYLSLFSARHTGSVYSVRYQ